MTPSFLPLILSTFGLYQNNTPHMDNCQYSGNPLPFYYRYNLICWEWDCPWFRLNLFGKQWKCVVSPSINCSKITTSALDSWTDCEIIIMSIPILSTSSARFYTAKSKTSPSIWNRKLRTLKNKPDGFSRISEKVQLFSKIRLTKRAKAAIIAHVDRLTAARQNRIMGICIVVVR